MIWCHPDDERTFVFTISVFLFSTFFVYYVFFLLVQMAILAVQLLIFLQIVVIDACPVYAIVLRCMDSMRFPCGIYIEIEAQHRCSDVNSTAASQKPMILTTTYMSLRCVPAPFNSLFYG